MRPVVYFVSGLPRSGSTLLVQILGQNPRFRVAGTSGLCDLLVKVRNEWDKIPEFRAMPQEDSQAAKFLAMASMFDSFFCDEPDVVSFDKSRSWLGHMEMLQRLLGPNRPAKVIVCIRDIREVLASLEMLWRKNAATRQIPQEAANYPAFQSCPGRLAEWMKNDGLVGMAFQRTVDAMHRGYRDRMLVLDYGTWTSEPLAAVDAIYNFLGEPRFRHDVNHVEQITHENDLAYDFPGLHTIRPKVEWQEPKWPSVLGDYAKPYEPLNALLFPSRPRNDQVNGT